MEFYSLLVASYIANLCEESRIPINNTKIQKLLYCAYGCILAVYNQRLCDEYPRAWQYGPVFPRVFSYINKKKDLLALGKELAAGKDILSLIEDAVRVFGKYSAGDLSAWTHKSGSPWDTVVNVFEDRNGIIPDHLIAEYFRDNVVKTAANG